MSTSHSARLVLARRLMRRWRRCWNALTSSAAASTIARAHMEKARSLRLQLLKENALRNSPIGGHTAR